MLTDVRCFNVPNHLRVATERALRRAGEDGFELFALWTGTRRGSEFDVRHCHVPEQDATRENDELLVHVGRKALGDLNRWLYANREILCAQIHSHPGDAYHSETDETFPIATTIGALSIVVPDFGREGLLGAGVVGYRLTAHGWAKLSADFIGHLVSFGD